jgi:phage terminase large subunit GpA-like protein
MIPSDIEIELESGPAGALQTKTTNDQPEGQKKKAEKPDDEAERIRKLNVTISHACRLFKPPEDIGVEEWSDKYRMLSPENSAEPGHWRTDRTPYLRGPFEAFTDPQIHTVVIVSSSQIGKTEAELCMMGYMIDVDPGPCMWVTPTVDAAEDFSKRRIAPMIRDTMPLKQKVEASKSRSSANSILKKKYPGGMLTLTGSNSPVGLASVPSRYVFGDEIDRWATDAGGEGDPWSLLEARTTTFYNKKMVMVSTPTVKGRSRIARAFDQGTKEYWSVECPHCGEYIFIKFEDIVFDHEKRQLSASDDIQYTVSNIRFKCPCCDQESSEDEIRKAPHKWVAKAPEAYRNGIRSFWINAFSSPWTSWSHIILRFLEASGNGDPAKLQTVFNTLLGELWEDRGDLQSEDAILERCEDYGADLPDGVLCLTCGVDTQDNRLEYEVVGYGPFGESWGIEYGVILGNPSAPDVPGMDSVWSRLDRIIDRTWYFQNGQGLKISLTLVDSGGHHTYDVYEQCAMRIRKRVFAVKGQGGEGVPYTKKPSKVDIIREGQVVGRAWLYVIGVDSGKEKIMYSLNVTEPGPGFSHFPKTYKAKYFNGLMSEKLVRKGAKWVWDTIPGHKRNEPLDCRNYANAACALLSPDWAGIRKRLDEDTAAADPFEKPAQPSRKVVYRQQKKRSYDLYDL